MVRLSDTETLVAAWRALGGNADCEGWRTIPVGTALPCRLFAGRHFPGNEEAILIGFKSLVGRSVGNLPEGRGFAVTVVELPTDAEKHFWFALLRLETGSLEIFTMMACDVIANLDSSDSEDDEHLIDLFLGRIRAWQSFMQHGRDGILDREAETGLYGELVLLTSLLQSQVRPLKAIECWRGPFDAVHDFQLGLGAIEVKTTVANSGFSATVSSLEQLDDGLAKPLFIAAVRLRLDESGCTLPDRITLIRDMLRSDPQATSAFETRLLHAGFFSSMSARYSRRFLHRETRFFPVQDDFPRLIRSRIPAGIRQARYEIELDSINIAGVSLNAALRLTGVLT